MSKERIFFTVAVLIGLVSLGIILNLELRKSEAAWVKQPLQIQDSLNSRLVETLSFGHLPALVDMLWIRVLQDEGLTHVAQGNHPPFYFDLKLITDLDPLNYEAYVYGSSLLVIVRDDKEGAKEILEKGEIFRKHYLSLFPRSYKEKYWRQEWFVPLYLGYVYLFELQDLAEGAKAFSELEHIKSAPPYLREIASRFKSVDDQYKSGLRLLSFLIESSKEERIKERYKDRRKALFVGQYLYQINKKFKEYLGDLKEYRKSLEVSHDKLKKYWGKFLDRENLSGRDPLGGKLSVLPSGKISTTTHQVSTFGMEY